MVLIICMIGETIKLILRLTAPLDSLVFTTYTMDSGFFASGARRQLGWGPCILYISHCHMSPNPLPNISKF